MNTSSIDWAIRSEAFRHVQQLQSSNQELTSADIGAGFQFQGARIPLVNPQRGIFKPRQMDALLSIKTVFPKPGGKVWYEDQVQAHQKIYAGEESIEYSFMGKNSDAADNRWLRDAMEWQVPIIYFIGTSPARYQAVFPAFISSWDPALSKVLVTFSDPHSHRPPTASPNATERRYALRIVKQRLHQASFREAVISAYRSRCAVSGLPEPLLLDAAHIVADGDQEFGQPVVSNGIPMSKIHHAAFDANLIGIDPDFRVHVSPRLMGQKDGPLLESIKRLHHTSIHLPRRRQDRPDRDRLAIRFERFLSEIKPSVP